MNQTASVQLNKVPHASPPTLSGLEDCKSERWTSHQQYEADVRCARANFAMKLIDAFESLDKLTEPEFFELMKTATDGVSACDLLEKFRKWKGL